MATKTISITEEAYNRLANLKKENESFSMIINRVTQKKKLSDFFGVLSKESGERLEKVIKEGREKNRKLHDLRNKKLKEAFS